ncbi:tRNA(Met) cytidine acetyltransferase TmcA [Amphritea sp. HPY]|uniref:tRNA(Met) cytidine acetyltransferase TmcA n=1 Tax=Amphritea sp. HPY TaxID=3421652 RepID=UPI003D7E3ED4
MHLQQVQRFSPWRQLLLISGEKNWSERLLHRAFSAAENCLWIGDQAVGGMQPCIGMEQISPKQAHQVLGQEREVLIFDSWSGFNPNAFGQTSGIVVAGGILVLVIPALDSWQAYDDPEYRSIATTPYRTEDVGRRFISHLRRCIGLDERLTLVEQDKPLPEIWLPDQPDPRTDFLPPYRSDDQQQMVEQIVRHFLSPEQPLLTSSAEPVVITADRGRGKSAALGIVAAKLLQAGYRDIAVTAPSKAAVQPLMMLAEQQSQPCEQNSGLIHTAQGQICFYTPDKLLAERPRADLLLVDEAAAIPAPVLKQMLEQYPRIIFASTIHGYEGTGQGFAVRFRQVLDRLTPGWLSLTLSQPIRWANDDPLEQFTYSALLLDAEPASEVSVQGGAISYRRLNRDQVIADPGLLEELFGLLVLAHYRTTPGDLRIMLDSPNLQVWAAFSDTATNSGSERHLLATALVAEEGPIEPDLAAAIMAGKRRPRGHLIPQTLLAHSGIQAAASYSGLRVMRIAVHPALQRRGIGLNLLHYIECAARQQAIDWLGTSFGLTSGLHDFWNRAGMIVARVGFTRDKVSGTHAGVMLKGVSEQGVEFQQQVQQQWQQALPELAKGELADLEPDLMTRLKQE